MKHASKFNILARLSACSLLALSACASPVASGAVLGTATGAGAGALVGGIISNGDIATSALLGGAIGLPIGLILGTQWQKDSDEAIEMAKMNQYMQNQQDIIAREREIESLRHQVLRETPGTLPAEELKEHLYMGPSLGVPTR